MDKSINAELEKLLMSWICMCWDKTSDHVASYCPVCWLDNISFLWNKKPQITKYQAVEVVSILSLGTLRLNFDFPRNIDDQFISRKLIKRLVSHTVYYCQCLCTVCLFISIIKHAKTKINILKTVHLANPGLPFLRLLHCVKQLIKRQMSEPGVYDGVLALLSSRYESASSISYHYPTCWAH